MTARGWPERQGNASAIILVEAQQKGEYKVFEQTKTGGPWFEGSVFRGPESWDIVSSIDGSFVVYHHYLDGNGVSSDIPIGLAHSKPEIPRRVYECAVKYCKKLAKRRKGKFVDLTSRAQESQLEASAQRQPSRTSEGVFHYNTPDINDYDQDYG